MTAPIIEVANLSKRYRIGAHKERYLSLRDEIGKRFHALRRRLRTALSRPLTSDLRPLTPSEDFWALKDVSFTVQAGETVGIIGQNGAGKSTLLKILCQITPPTEGKVTMRGRVASLLEVGTGFHPELTGRENIILNGAILGMSRAEIRRKFDEIVAFAEVDQFIDTPVKRYSSGMYVRLAFAVAAHLEPEILIVDEVLAVGDAEFQKKCLGKMQDVSRREGRTVLFVSHNMGAVASLCPGAFWLEGGKIRRKGVARSVINDYLTQRGTDDSKSKTLNLEKFARQHGGGDRLKLESLEWLCNVPLQHGEPVCARVHFRIKRPVADTTVGIGFSTMEGTRVLTYETDFQNGHRPSFSEAGTYSARVEIDSLPLAPGIYSLDIGCRSGDSHGLDYLPAAVQVEVIPGPKTPGYIVRQDAGVRLPSRWSWDAQLPPPNTAPEIMRSEMKRLINRVLGAQRLPHWTDIANGIDFRSGLGDSAWLLYGLCRSMKPSVCVEIGSARGKSACFIGMALKENGSGQVYAIDPHIRTNWNDSESMDTYEVMRANLERLGLQDVVTMIRKTSVEAMAGWSKPIDLMFIDGDHSYEGVKADWEGFKPFVKPFGLVVFHDTIWDLKPDPKWYRADMGVPRFVEELRRDGYQVLTIDRDFGVSAVQPVRGGNPLGRLPGQDD